MQRKSLVVFLDANVVIRTGKPPGKPLMERLEDLVTSGFIKIVTTDLTKIEIAKKHANNDFDEIGGLGRKRFRALVKQAVGIDLPSISPIDLHRKLFDHYMSGTDAMFNRLKAEVLSIDEILPSNIFNQYSHKLGLFARDAKKDQFPDAFIFECLKLKANERNEILVVTDDGDFSGAVDQTPHISRLKSIAEIFERLGLKSEAAPDVEEFFESNDSEVVKVVDGELDSWGLQVSDIEDAEIDVSNVESVEFLNFVTFSAAGDGNEILVVGRLKMDVDISYSHPDWNTAMYDSEDKVLIPFDSVSGEKIVELEADFSMTVLVDENGKPEQIDEFSFLNDSFIWVSLEEYENYK